MADLKKLLQRELKVLPPGSDSVGPASTDSSMMSASHVATAAEIGSTNGVSRVDVAAAAAAAVGVHTAAQHHLHMDSAEPSSPATLTVSEVGAGRHRNSSTDGFAASYASANAPWSATGRGDGLASGGRTRRLSHRSSTGLVAPSGGAVMMAPVDSEYDFMRELNFKYLRHVVLKFMLSRESEVSENKSDSGRYFALPASVYCRR